MKTNIRVNNTTHELSVDSRVTLLDALEGFNRGHAVLGVSEHCIATHPSDMCVALAIGRDR